MNALARLCTLDPAQELLEQLINIRLPDVWTRQVLTKCGFNTDRLACSARLDGALILTSSTLMEHHPELTKSTNELMQLPTSDISTGF